MESDDGAGPAIRETPGQERIMYALRPTAGVPLGAGWDITYSTLAAAVAAAQRERDAQVVDADTLQPIAWGIDPATGIIVDMEDCA